jgi:hypothetical protein
VKRDKIYADEEKKKFERNHFKRKKLQEKID